MSKRINKLANERTIPTNKRTNEAREEARVALSYRRGRLLSFIYAKQPPECIDQHLLSSKR